MQETRPSTIVSPSPWGYLALLVFAILLGAGVASLPDRYVTLIAVLTIGLPLAGLVVVNSASQRIGLVLLLALVPLTGILKAITTNRFAPLTFDLGILLACAFSLIGGLLWQNARLGWLDLMLGAFLGLALVQMFNPNVPSLQAGLEGLRKFAFMSIAFYAGRRMFREREMALFQKLLVALSVPISVYGVKQFFSPSALDYRLVELATASPVTYLMGGHLRPFSTTPGPFQLGLYLLVVISLLVCRMINSPGSLTRRVIPLAVLGLHVVTLFLTRTKGNWVGLAAGLALLVLLRRGRASAKIRLLLLAALAGGLVVVLFLTFAPADYSRVLDQAIFAVTHPAEAPTLLYRLQIWQETIIPAFLRQPILGYGTSSAGEGLKNLYAGTPSLYFASHNLYIKVLLEMGLVGLALFTGITAASLLRGWKTLRQLDPSQRRQIILFQWSLMVVLCFLVAGLVIPVLDAYPANYYFWLLLGVLSRGAAKNTV